MSKTVFAFGRMNPPTIGHEKLAMKVASEAKKRRAMPHIFLSHSQDKKKNPLTYNQKIMYATKAFGKMVTKSSARTIIQVMQDLQKMGHTEVVLVAGSDRVTDFKNLLEKYNGKDYTFDKIEVISAGARDPDASGVEGMSGTKLRGLAQSGDFDTFKQGLASKLSDGDKKKIYNIIRTISSSYEEILGGPEDENDVDIPFTEDELDDLYNELLSDEEDWDTDIDWSVNGTDIDFTEEKEHLIEREPLTLQQRMKKRLQMRRLAPKIARKRKIALRRKAGRAQLLKRSRKAAIAILKKKFAGQRGADYKKLKPAEKISIDRIVSRKLEKSRGLIDRIAKKLLPKVTKRETERFKNLNKKKTNEEKLFELYFKVDVEGLPSVYIEAPSASTVRSDLRKVIRNPGENIKDIERVERSDIVKAFRLRAQNPGAPLDTVDEEVSKKQLSDLEKFGDRLLDKFGIDISFSKHFVDRMNDDRNKPEIKIAELQKLFKKIAKNKAVNIKKHPNAEVVLKDIQKDLNLPVAIKTDKDGELDVVHKTIMRKKNFGTTNPVIKYESVELEEGVNDPSIFKAVFLAGGPGSGKSFVVGKTALTAFGLKVVNVDDVFERALKKAGLETTPKDIFSPKGQEIRGKAAEITNTRHGIFLKGRLGLVLDGTGKDYKKIKSHATLLKKMGYDVAMLFVNTNLETALTRNRQRARTLPDDQVEKMWKAVQDNIGKFQSFFGANFTVVDNSDDVDWKANTNNAYKKISKFTKIPPKARAAKNWIKQEKSRRGITEEYFEEYLLEKGIEGLKNKAEKSDIPYDILKEVFDRGIKAWESNNKSDVTPQQWAFARVNSFIAEGLTTRSEDADLWDMIEGKAEFKRDKKVPNLVVPKRTTDFEFSQYLNRNKGRQVDYYKSMPSMADMRRRRLITGEEEVDEKKVPMKWHSLSKDELKALMMKKRKEGNPIWKTMKKHLEETSIDEQFIAEFDDSKILEEIAGQILISPDEKERIHFRPSMKPKGFIIMRHVKNGKVIDLQQVKPRYAKMRLTSYVKKNKWRLLKKQPPKISEVKRSPYTGAVVTGPKDLEKEKAHFKKLRAKERKKELEDSVDELFSTYMEDNLKERMSALQKLRNFDKSRVAVGKKAIFTDKSKNKQPSKDK